MTRQEFFKRDLGGRATNFTRRLFRTKSSSTPRRKGEGGEQEKRRGMRRRDVCNDFDCFKGLVDTHDADDGAEDATVTTGHDGRRRGRERVDASVARAVVVVVNGELTFSGESRGGDERSVGKNGGVVDEVPSGRVIGTVENEGEFRGIGRKEGGDVVGREMGLDSSDVDGRV